MISSIASAEILGPLRDQDKTPTPARADAEWFKPKSAPKGGSHFILDAKTTEVVSCAVCTYGYGLSIRFSLRGLKELREAPKNEELIWIAGNKELFRLAPGAHSMSREIFWVPAVGEEELHLEDAKQLVQAISGSKNESKGPSLPSTAQPNAGASSPLVPADPSTATSEPGALNGFTQSTRTLSRTFLDGLKDNESVCWGRMDESAYYYVFGNIPSKAVTKEAAAFAETNGSPLWGCVKTIPLLLGKVDFFTKPENRRVRLVFVEKDTKEKHEVQLLSGVGGDSLFYIVLPKGKYQLEVNQRWGDNNPPYNATADMSLVVPGGRSAVHIGHLRMGVDARSNSGGKGGPSLVLFDTANAESAQAWFKAMHPSFKGETTSRYLVPEPAVVDQAGKLYYWHKEQKAPTAISGNQPPERGWIGISTESVDGSLRIAAIAPESPAMNAGLKGNAIIVSIDNQKVTTPIEFSAAVKKHAVGDLVTLKLSDAGKEFQVEVKLGKKPAD